MLRGAVNSELGLLDLSIWLNQPSIHQSYNWNTHLIDIRNNIF